MGYRRTVCVTEMSTTQAAQSWCCWCCTNGAARYTNGHLGQRVCSSSAVLPLLPVGHACCEIPSWHLHDVLTLELFVQHGGVIAVYVLLVRADDGEAVGPHCIYVCLDLPLWQVAPAQHPVYLVLAGLLAAHIYLELCKGGVACRADAGMQVVLGCFTVPVAVCDVAGPADACFLVWAASAHAAQLCVIAHKHHFLRSSSLSTVMSRCAATIARRYMMLSSYNL